MGSFLQKSATKFPKKWGIDLKKGGTKQSCPPKLTCVLDAEFDVDYDSAIKHDLTQCYDKVMDVQS